MGKHLLKSDLAQHDWNIADRIDLFVRIGREIVDAGYARASFTGAIASRETRYPTALPTLPEAVAIPHTDAKHIIRPFIAPVRLASPIPWAEMGDDDVIHPVRLVFVLGIDRPGQQIDILRSLSAKLQDSAFFSRLISAGTPEEFYCATLEIEDVGP